jgi:hypothetical protein
MIIAQYSMNAKLTSITLEFLEGQSLENYEIKSENATVLEGDTSPSLKFKQW